MNDYKFLESIPFDSSYNLVRTTVNSEFTISTIRREASINPAYLSDLWYFETIVFSKDNHILHMDECEDNIISGIYNHIHNIKLGIERFSLLGNCYKLESCIATKSYIMNLKFDYLPSFKGKLNNVIYKTENLLERKTNLNLKAVCQTFEASKYDICDLLKDTLVQIYSRDPSQKILIRLI